MGTNSTPSPTRQVASLLVAAGGRATVFTGAGMSTESGLPDFRSNGGLWKHNRRFEDLASVDALDNAYDEHVEFYRWRISMLDGHAPHDGHHIVAGWQRRGLVDTIVTQNVDGFHTRAGATGVLELHGTLANVRCQRCGDEQPARTFLDVDGTRCACGGKRRPGVVLFGEALPAAVLDAAWRAARRARLFVVLGSSLLVAPANLLPQAAAAAGAPLVIVNHDPTPLDSAAALVISAPIGQTLREVDTLLPPPSSLDFR
jgi:NAD-dependent deacetylase